MKKLPKINTAKLLKAALPYIFIGLMATKLGQAYRMVPEGDVLDKALGALLNIGTAFQNPFPSFHPFDLMVGAACGVLIWFIVYQKAKNARKYRRGAEYAEWAAEKTGKSWKARLRQTIDKVLPKVSTFDEFLEAMRQEGYEVVQSKKILKFRAQGQERFTRSKTLGTDYTLEALQERIGKTQLPKRKKIHLQKDGKVNLLMDIQARLQGRGPGLERWMKIHNLKEASKTLNYLTEH